MEDLNESLRLQPGLAAALIDRGNAYCEKGSLEEAIADYDAAISRSRSTEYSQLTNVGDGHFYRAVARCALADWDGAKEDLSVASREGILVASSFRNILGNVSRFEAKYGVRVPSDVATALYNPSDDQCWHAQANSEH